jgi:drug/metabolite transporter (DMT)-like permease
VSDTLPEEAHQPLQITPHALTGILLMLGGMTMFAFNDALGKALMTSFSAGQVMFMRSLTALIVLLPFVYRGGWRRMAVVQHPWLQLLRSALMAFEGISFYFAVGYMPLADVVTFWLAAPLYVAAMSPVFLGESVGLMRWLAILAGFGGVVLAMGPSAQSFSPPAVLALCGSGCFAVAMILGRKLRGTADVVMVGWQLVAALIGAAVWAVNDPGGWQAMSVPALSELSLLGVISMLAHILTNRAFKFADASVVMPFQYVLLIWAILLGWVFFNDIPRPSMLVGGGMVVAAGLFIATRR